MALKERLVHLLALGPRNFLQVQAAVPKDTLLIRDKNRLKQVLNSVAEFRNNAYELRGSMWTLVREEWPFFSEEDRSVVRRSRPSMTPTPPRNNSSPKDPTNKQSDSQGGANKQPSPSSDKENPSESLRLSPYQVPKGRVAHVKQVLENRKSAQGASSPDEKPGMQACTTPPIEVKTHSDANTKLEPTPEKPISLAVNSKQAREVVAKPEDVSKSVAEAIPAVEKSAKEEVRPTVIPPNDESNPSEPISSTTSLNTIPTSCVTQLQPNKNKDFLTKFTAIKTEEQKKEYKELYREGLAMYREQYQVIDSYNVVSEQLAKKLKAAKAKEDLVKVEKVKEMVRKKYKEMQEDARCQEALSNFQHLHEKLSHLRMLVERRQEEEKLEIVKKINNQPGDTMPIFA